MKMVYILTKVSTYASEKKVVSVFSSLENIFEWFSENGLKDMISPVFLLPYQFLELSKKDKLNYMNEKGYFIKEYILDFVKPMDK